MPYKDQAKFNEYRNRWTAKRREFWNSLKDAPCTDCGIRYPPYVMQWDHTGDDKEFTIAKFWQYSKSRVLAEIKKCELVCANCHAERTHSRAALPQLAEGTGLDPVKSEFESLV